jgi:hypothetical protein
MRRTASNLVLPRVVREEVVVGYGRQLKREAKLFEEAWNRYRRVDLSDDAQRHFFKPDFLNPTLDTQKLTSDENS